MVEVAAFSDSSPLVIFAKLKALPVPCSILGPIGVPPAVYQEAVVRGRATGKPDAILIERAVHEGLLVRYEVDDRETKLADELMSVGCALGRGECEAIACGEAHRIPVMLQDRKARALAAARGVRTLYPETVLLYGLLRRKIGLDEYGGMLFGLARLTGMGAAMLVELQDQASEIDRILKQG